jgi:hypothetical protein
VLLALSLALFACNKGTQSKKDAKQTEAKSQATPKAKPSVPQSVVPGWKLVSLVKSGAPGSVPAAGSPDCWEASYTGSGNALVWLCRYADTTSALHASESAKASAQIVIFQEREYLVVVEWSAESIADLTALIHAVHAVKENLNIHPRQ